MLRIGLVRICAGGVQKWTSLPRTSVEGGPSRIGGRLTGSEAAPGAPERAADFGASVATAIHHRAHRPSAQRALRSFHRPATTRRFTVARRPVPFGVYRLSRVRRRCGPRDSSGQVFAGAVVDAPEFGPPAESAGALSAGRQPIRPVSSWRLVLRQTRPRRRRLQQPRA